MNIAEKLQFYREQKGYTVNKLANLAGLSQSHVREIQLGTRNPTIDTLELLCDALDLSVVNFLSEEHQELLQKDDLQSLIYSLNKEQREGLKTFLHTMVRQREL